MCLARNGGYFCFLYLSALLGTKPGGQFVNIKASQSMSISYVAEI